MDMPLLPTILQGPQASPVLTPAADFRLNASAVITPSAGGVGQRRAGVLPGASQAGATLGTNQITIAPFQAWIPGTSQVDQGGYTITSLNNATFNPAVATLPSTGSFKKCRVVARVYDSLYDSSGKNLWSIDVVEGAQAATLASAQLPAVPANAISLLDFSITSGGVITTIAGPPVTGLTTGVRPAYTTDTDNGVFLGEQKWDQSLGTQEWFSGLWVRHPRHWGRVSSYPTSPAVGDRCTVIPLYNALMEWNGIRWTQAGGPVVVSAVERDAIVTNAVNMLHNSFMCWVFDTAELYRWDGSQWLKVAGLDKLVYTNGNMGGSNQVGPGQAATPITQSFNLPVSTHKGLLVVNVAVASTGSNIGRLVVAIANASQTSIYNVGTTACNYAFVMPYGAAAGSVSFVVQLYNDSGGSNVFLAHTSAQAFY